MTNSAERINAVVEDLLTTLRESEETPDLIFASAVHLVVLLAKNTTLTPLAFMQYVGTYYDMTQPPGNVQ